MENKDIFTMLIEKELASENPNACIEKYGQLFLKKLEVIGNQLEQALLHENVDKLNDATLIIVEKDYFKRASKGIHILELVEKELQEDVAIKE